jgi:paraquat-inducible protein B
MKMKTQINQKIQSVKTNWYVWIFPVIALLFCGWLLFKYLHERGPMIQIHFEDASSLQAEKTKVRFRGVPIGTVKSLSISDDNKEVIANISLNKDAEQFAVEGSKFWVVSPKVNIQGISGLETIFEGTYIAVQPGKPDAEFKDDFKGLLSSETSESVENTTAYFLETSNAESMTVGDSVTFRGIPVGTITKVTLAKTSQQAHIQINIHNRYVKLIRTNTVFWRKIGIQANLGLFNSEIKMNSLDSILHGGIDFFTPDDAGPIAKGLSHFPLSQAPPKDYQKWNPKLEFN